MAIRSIKEYLESGDVNGITVGDNITMKKTNATVYEDMYWRVGVGGVFALHRVQEADVEWVDTTATQSELSTGYVQVLSVTVDEEVLSTQGSYVISG